MNWLFLSILSSVGIFVSFGYFGRWAVDNRWAVAVNYTFCAVGGILLSPIGGPQFNEVWWIPALMLGTAFTYLFVKMAALTQSGGLALSTIASQMSLLIPVALAPLLYGETLGLWRALGIGVGLVSIGLMVTPSKRAIPAQNPGTGRSPWVDTLIIFLGTGLCTALVKYSRFYFVGAESELLFVGCVFGIAAFWAWVGVVRAPRLDRAQAVQSTWAGLVLGIPNLGSLVFLVKALGSGLDSAWVFPMNNLGIVLISSVAGWLIFGQRLGIKSLLGIGAALVAVVLMR
ncbi:hypothetical protein GC167_00535 [bacterium]|nr:hypothetical protein [bacterium]